MPDELCDAKCTYIQIEPPAGVRWVVDCTYPADHGNIHSDGEGLVWTTPGVQPVMPARNDATR